jgi:hypothetical protein
MLGMLGKTLHASGSSFRMLPNPTIYHWDRKAFSMWKLLEAYRDKIDVTDDLPENEQIMKLKKDLERIFKARNGAAKYDFSVAILDALHHALDSTDKFLTQTVQEYLVYGILRGHYQAVLGQISKQGDESIFKELSTATPEERQAKLIDIYFNAVRVDAIQHAPKRKFTTNLNGTMSPTPEPNKEDSQTTISRSQTGFQGDDKLNTIWCTLVFRMLCWLLLHDFHKMDIQLSKSEVLGSRLPVYIN